jgi:hypothetical protein
MGQDMPYSLKRGYLAEGLCLWTVSSVFALYYAVVQLLQHGQGWPLVVSAAIGLSAVLLTVVLVLRYRPRRKSMKGEGNNE